MTDFGWDYPPGVTGNEPEIQGWPECPECGGAFDENGECEECGYSGYSDDPWDREPDEDDLIEYRYGRQD